jgi:hypothetical protein
MSIWGECLVPAVGSTRSPRVPTIAAHLAEGSGCGFFMKEKKIEKKKEGKGFFFVDQNRPHTAKGEV